MKKVIQIRVIPNAKREEIREESGILKVKVQAPPEDGRANKAVIRLISKFFNVKKSTVSIIRGEKSREKIIQIG